MKIELRRALAAVLMVLALGLVPVSVRADVKPAPGLPVTGAGATAAALGNILFSATGSATTLPSGLTIPSPAFVTSDPNWAGGNTFSMKNMASYDAIQFVDPKGVERAAAGYGLLGDHVLHAAVNAGGTGYGATATGTMTWVGSGCSVSPVLNVTTNGSGVITTINSITAAGICSLPNTLPPSTATTWTPGGGLSAGSGASFATDGCTNSGFSCNYYIEISNLNGDRSKTGFALVNTIAGPVSHDQWEGLPDTTTNFWACPGLPSACTWAKAFSISGSTGNITEIAKHTINPSATADTSTNSLFLVGAGAGNTDAIHYLSSGNGASYLGFASGLVLGTDQTDLLFKTGITSDSPATGTVRLTINTTGATFAVPAITKNYTVGTLPAGVAGARAHVTDAMACTFNAAPTGGGSTVCPVWYSGAAWVEGALQSPANDNVATVGA